MKTENEIQNKENFNFFDKTQEVVSLINRQSYKKLVFLSVVSIVSLVLSVSVILSVKNTIKQHHEVSVLQSKNDALKLAEENALKKTQLAKENDYYINQVKSINKEDFGQFLKYLKINQSAYDDEANLIMNSDMQAEKLSNSLNAVEATKRINQALSLYKKNIEWKINSFSDTYNRVQTNNENNQPMSVYKDFLEFYHNYQAKVITTNPTVEVSLNNELYYQSRGNVEFNKQNNIYEKVQQMQNTRNNLLSK